MSANRAILTIIILGIGIFAVRGFMKSKKEQVAEEKIEVVKEEGENEDGLSIKINDEEVKIDGLKEALGGLEESLKSLGDGKEGEMIDFRELKAMLPEKLLGLKRISSNGEKSGITGFMVSKAEAVYENDDQRLEIELIDLGGMALAKVGIAAWANVEIDRESDDGYERTYTKGDVRYHEEYDSEEKEGSLKALYKGRIVLSIEAENFSAKVFEKVLKKLDVEDLKL